MIIYGISHVWNVSIIMWHCQNYNRNHACAYQLIIRYVVPTWTDHTMNMGKRKHRNTKLAQCSSGVDSTHVMLKVFTPAEKHDPLQSPLRVRKGPLLTRQAMYHAGCFISMFQEGKFFTWFFSFPIQVAIYCDVYHRVYIHTPHRYADNFVVLGLVFYYFAHTLRYCSIGIRAIISWNVLYLYMY